MKMAELHPSIYNDIKKAIIKKHKTLYFLSIENIEYRNGLLYIDIKYKHKKKLLEYISTRYVIIIYNTLKKVYTEYYNELIKNTINIIKNEIVDTEYIDTIMRNDPPCNERLTIEQLATLIIEEQMPISYTIYGNNGYTYYVPNGYYTSYMLL